MRWFSRRLNAERKERNERKKFELEKGRGRGENGRGMRMRKKKKRIREISFRTTTFRFHRSYTSRWIPIQLAALSHSVSFSATRGRALLIGAAKSMLERTTKGMMIGYVYASLLRVNRLREKIERNLKIAG